MSCQVFREKHLLIKSRISSAVLPLNITLTLQVLKAKGRLSLRSTKRGSSMRGLSRSRKLMRYFRTLTPKNATMIILATTLNHHLEHLITRLIRRMSVWRERLSLRGFGKKSIARLSGRSRSAYTSRGRQRSTLGGWSPKKNTLGNSSVGNSKRCGSMSRIRAAKIHKIRKLVVAMECLQYHLVQKAGFVIELSRQYTKRNLTKRGGKGTRISTSKSIWRDKNNRVSK